MTQKTRASVWWSTKPSRVLPGLGPTMLLHITSLMGAGVLHEGTTNICKLIMCVKCSEELLALNAHTARRHALGLVLESLLVTTWQIKRKYYSGDVILNWKTS